MRKLALWGYHFDEYLGMFDLSLSDLTQKKLRILEYHCGPSAVNKELNEKKLPIVSCDPLYNLNEENLQNKLTHFFPERALELRQEKNKLDLSLYEGDVEKLIQKRKEGLDLFFADYEKGKAEGRYLGCNEKELPFEHFSFDIAISTYYLFSDLDIENAEFHLKIIKELARVAKEVRIFPLLDSNNKPSSFLGPVLLGLQQENYGAEVKEVPYHLQPSGNAMLRVWSQQCELSL